MRLEHFELIDRVQSLDERHIVATAQVPHDGSILGAHFPGHPLMPGVLLIEAMAQASGWLVIAAEGFTRLGLLAQVREAKFRAPVTPGQRLTIEADLEHAGSGYAVTRARIRADAARVSESELTIRLIPFPSAAAAATLRETAARIGIVLPPAAERAADA